MNDRMRYDERDEKNRDRVHDFDQRVDRGAGGVLRRVADRISDDGRFVRVGMLASKVAALNVFLRVVPRTPAGRHHECERESRQDHSEQDAREGDRPEDKPDQ